MNAVESLQKKIGTGVDGDFGPLTARALRRHWNLTNAQAAMFIGQCQHESANFKTFSENLNYSATALMSVFGTKYFPTVGTANLYERQPEKIANRVYANRMGNGSEDSGDGWRYRGRGAIQLTGKNNYISFGNSICNAEVTANPDIVANEFAFDSAKWFFDVNGLWKISTSLTDASIKEVTRRINGGYNGLDDRLTKVKYWSRVI